MDYKNRKDVAQAREALPEFREYLRGWFRIGPDGKLLRKRRGTLRWGEVFAARSPGYYPGVGIFFEGRNLHVKYDRLMHFLKYGDFPEWRKSGKRKKP